jgi:hypothetical protein
MRSSRKYISLVSFVVCVSLFSTARSQQTATIKIDSGDRNRAVIGQSGRGVKQEAGETIKGNGNLAEIKQVQQDTIQGKPGQPATPEKSRSFTEWVTNTNNFFVLLISVATFIGLAWKGIPYLKKMKRK